MTCDHVFALGVEVAEMVADHPLLTLRRHLLEGGGVQELPRPSDNSHSVTFVSEPPPCVVTCKTCRSKWPRRGNNV